MLHAKQSKTDKSDANKMTKEPAQKLSSHALTHTPAWTSTWGDHPPLKLQLSAKSAAPGIQAKLAISQPNDPYEQEADRVAEHVMRTPISSPLVQHKCACGGIAGPTGECEECALKRKTLQHRPTQQASESTAPPIVNQVLNSGNGQPLDASMRAFMEPRFGSDFSQVRVHTDAKAAESAQSVSALAYTVGSDVVFGRGQYQPGTGEGQRLLAHELTHVVQQNASIPSHRYDLATNHSLHLSKQLIHLAREEDPADDEEDQPDDKKDQPDAEAEAGEVTEIRIDPSSGRTEFETGSGEIFQGEVATDLSAGHYEIIPNPDKQIWQIPNSKPGLRFEVFLGKTDPWKLSYSVPVSLDVGAGLVTLPSKPISIQERITQLTDLIQKFHTGDEDEQTIIRIISETPAEQAAELVKQLSERKINDKSYFDELDRVVDGSNNLQLHEAFSRLRLRAIGDKSAKALANAPVLPWHDVMGFFEDSMTFSATRMSTGKIRIQYHAGTRVRNSKDFADEVKKLPFNIFVGGQDYDPNQPLIIHDYDDNGKYKVLVAQQLAGYEHAGIRKFLSDVATVASFVTPISAARTVAGKIAVITLERVLPAIFLLVDENRLNITKWFPKWGPQMLRYVDIVKAGVAIYGFARFAVSGWQVFKNWKQVRLSRLRLEGEATNAEAKLLAARLEKQADESISEAEKLHKQGTAGLEPQEPAGATTDLPTAAKGIPDETKAAHIADEAKATQVEGATQSKPIAPAKTPEVHAKIFEGISEETEQMLAKRPDLKQALVDNPKAAKLLKLCRSLCFPEGTTIEQVKRIQQLVEEAEYYEIPISQRHISEFLHQQTTTEEIEQAVTILEGELAQRTELSGQVKKVFEEAAGPSGEPSEPATPPTTKVIRAQEGEAIGGDTLKDIKGKWFVNGQRGAFPGQIARQMKGMRFKNWREFRMTFWKLVAKDGELSQGWKPDQLKAMSRGLAPRVPKSQATGGGPNAVFQLDHMHPLELGGELYDLDNLQIVTPKFHADIGG